MNKNVVVYLSDLMWSVHRSLVQVLTFYIFENIKEYPTLPTIQYVLNGNPTSLYL
jgi:hypothetical protein